MGRHRRGYAFFVLFALVEDRVDAGFLVLARRVFAVSELDVPLAAVLLVPETLVFLAAVLRTVVFLPEVPLSVALFLTDDCVAEVFAVEVFFAEVFAVPAFAALAFAVPFFAGLRFTVFLGAVACPLVDPVASASSSTAPEPSDWLARLALTFSNLGFNALGTGIGIGRCRTTGAAGASDAVALAAAWAAHLA